jgi:soluble lytic murein transglycosylase
MILRTIMNRAVMPCLAIDYTDGLTIAGVPMFVATAPRHVSLSGLMLALGLLFVALSAHAGEPTDAQRAAFKQAYASAQQGGDDWRQLAGSLRDYPLYPYLPAAALEHDLKQTDLAAVQAYLKQYPDWIPAADLRRDFLYELARRQDWNGFLALYQPNLGDGLTCDALQAKLSRGGTLDFDRDLADLWSKPSLPDACDPVLSAANDQGLLTTARLWSRIERAAEAGQSGTIGKLANWLPQADRVSAQQLAQALRDPASAVAAASRWPDTLRTREAATLALTRLAKRQSASADSAWQNLQTHFTFTPEQRDQILRTLALFHATDFDENALARLIDLPAAAQSDSTREWRARIALAQQDWNAVLDAIAAMSDAQKADGEWRYFRARALTALNRGSEAQTELASLAKEPTFFGFMAADKLSQPYAICPLQIAGDPQREQGLLARPGLLRAFELYAVGLPKFARREWSRALQGDDQTTLRLAADLANQRGWYDRAILTLNGGDALRLYDLRFPLARQDGMAAQAEQAGIDPAWAYAILRAESAWMTDARSGADARGLMQLLPATAAIVARSNGLNWNGGDSLYDPTVNITLGTRYLAQLAGRYNGAPWLSSAAYNAGPNRVDQWLSARGTLAPDVFVATIPYKETREYVARVMAFSVIYDWRLNGKVVPLADRMTAIGQPYGLPNAMTVKRSVDCPASAVIDKPESPPAPIPAAPPAITPAGASSAAGASP